MILESLIESVENEKSPVKQILFDCIKDVLPFVVKLFQLYISDYGTYIFIIEMSLQIMNVFWQFFVCLRKQAGLTIISQIFSSFIDTLEPERLVWSSNQGAELICKYTS